jgi:hypothetical protein
VRRKPTDVWIRSYRDVGQNGRNKDRGKRIELKLRRVKRGGRVIAWDAVFQLHAHRVHYVHVIAECPFIAAWNMRVEATG